MIVAPRAQYIPVGAAAVQIYNPPITNLRPHVIIFNTGPSTVYVGGASVTSSSGLPLASQEALNLPHAPTALYAACGGVTVSGTAVTNVATAVSGGTSSNLTVGTTGGFAVGNQVQIGTGANAEIATIASFSSSTVMVMTANLVYDHAAGQTVALITGSSPGTVRSQAGTS